METKKKVKIVILACVILVVAAVTIDSAVALNGCSEWAGRLVCYMK